MPNWVFCSLEVSARSRKPKGPRDAGLAPDEHGRVSDLAAFIVAAQTPEAYLGKNGEADRIPFDFEAFIPTPMELYDVEKSYFPSGSPEEAEHKVRVDAMIAKYGSGTAYDFHCDKWDTKWNACECSVNNDWRRGDGIISNTKTEHSVVFCFQTAWGAPLALILAASQQWPKLKFSIDCEEEATMFNPFEAVFKGGRQVRLTEREPDNDEEDGDE
jgi:hypothetical protein